MTTTKTAPIDYTAVVRNLTNDMIATAHNFTAVRDGDGNLRDMTDAERAFTTAINAEWRRRFDRP